MSKFDHTLPLQIVFGVDVKPAADWWSFGAIMYHLLTGQVSLA